MIIHINHLNILYVLKFYLLLIFDIHTDLYSIENYTIFFTCESFTHFINIINLTYYINNKQIVQKV